MHTWNRLRRHARIGATMTALMATLPLGAAAAPVLQRLAPTSFDYTYGVNFNVLAGTGIGEVTGDAEAVDWMLGQGNMSSSGCELSDFDGFTAGRIAILQRGSCTFALKAENALAAGAIAAIIFAQGHELGAFDLVDGTLGAPYTTTPFAMPVLYATYALGTSLDGTTLHIEVPAPVGGTVPAPGTLALAVLGLVLMRAGARGRDHVPRRRGHRA